MNAKQLQSEIEATLMRNLEILCEVGGPIKSDLEMAILNAVRAMLKASAANLAQIYAPRIQDEPDELLHGEL